MATGLHFDCFRWQGRKTIHSSTILQSQVTASVSHLCTGLLSVLCPAQVTQATGLMGRAQKRAYLTEEKRAAESRASLFWCMAASMSFCRAAIRWWHDSTASSLCALIPAKAVRSCECAACKQSALACSLLPFQQ
jgi:hypothetical protein